MRVRDQEIRDQRYRDAVSTRGMPSPFRAAGEALSRRVADQALIEGCEDVHALRRQCCPHYAAVPVKDPLFCRKE